MRAWWEVQDRLADCCQECGTALLQDKQKNYCVACLDSDVDKDNPALNPQAALTQVKEGQRVFNAQEEPLNSGSFRLGQSLARTFSQAP
ncbi:hypothetical protein scyTo_0008343 [Scyliorhinus torazame]|uniref:Uncharacterized protein n=1 Tax=Scyliorhinus torazame TaxID=75743 RepID=A0A401P7V6_SCYTO|nr:hypothetical protein [Scyliorhinus torazame]